jgi:hypothetical protein
MTPLRRDRGGWRRAFKILALLGAISLVLVVTAPLDGVSDRIAAGQPIGAPGTDGTGGRTDSEVDTRLVLQLGMLFAALYVAFLCLWLSRTRGGWTPRGYLERLRATWGMALLHARTRLLGRTSAATGAGAPAVCSIAWKRGPHRSRFQAVISNPGDGRQRVVAESAGLPWPPKDARNPPTRELEAALASLVAQIVAAGWEPVQSDGSWTERRFVRRPTNLVALDVADAVAIPVEPRSAPRRIPLVTAALLVATASLAGVVLGRALDAGEGAPAVRAAAAAQTIDHDGLRVRLPSGWARAYAPAIVGFQRPLELRNSRERVSAVVERLPATSATLLPAALERTRPAGSPRPERVRLATGQPAWRYRLAHTDGTATTVLAAPTTAGVSTVACTSGPGAGVPDGCEALASGVTVPGSRPLEPGHSAAFLSRLPGTVSALEVARHTGTQALSTTARPGGQAAAARGLAQAHAVAAGTLAPLAGAGDDVVPAKTVMALSGTATAYTMLADAARAGSARRYDGAAQAVRAADVTLRKTLDAAAAAANAGGSRPAARRAPLGDTSTDLTLPLLGLLGAGVVVLAALSVAKEIRHAA